MTECPAADIDVTDKPDSTEVRTYIYHDSRRSLMKEEQRIDGAMILLTQMSEYPNEVLGELKSEMERDAVLTAAFDRNCLREKPMYGPPGMRNRQG